MKAFLKNQYDTLERCILVYPSILQTEENQFNGEDRLNTLTKQYNSLVNILIENGVKTYFLDLNGGSSQLFARDIGFVINDLLFISNMKKLMRRSEIEGLKEFAIKNHLNHYCMKSKVEGGDVIVHNNKVFIGQGDRSGEDAFIEIRNVLNSYNMDFKLIKVFFETSKIHLDCVFNVIDKDTCIISKDVFNKDEIIRDFRRVIQIDLDEGPKCFAANIVNIGKNNIICSSVGFTKVLQNYGYNTTYIEFDDINRDNGSLGCCVLPILRTSNQRETMQRQ